MLSIRNLTGSLAHNDDCLPHNFALGWRSLGKKTYTFIQKGTAIARRISGTTMLDHFIRPGHYHLNNYMRHGGVTSKIQIYILDRGTHASGLTYSNQVRPQQTLGKKRIKERS